MDLDSLRHKRLKLFDQRLSHSDQAMAPPEIKTSQGNIDDDEKYARELQAEIEREERPLNKPQDLAAGAQAPEYEKAAQQMQSYYQSLAFNGNQTAFHNFHNPFTAYPQPPSTPDSFPGANSSMPNFFPPPGAYHQDGGLPDPFAHQLQQIGAQPSLHQAPIPPVGYTAPLVPHHHPQTGALMPGTYHAERRRRAPKFESPPSTYVVAQAVDYSDDAVAVHLFADTTTNINCRRCHDARSMDSQKLALHFDGLFDESNRAPLNFLLSCSTCASKTCLGCGATLSTDSLEYGATTEQGLHFTWHCDRGRLALFWLLLSGYDHRAKHNKPIETSQRKLPEPNKSRHRKHAHHHHHPHAHKGGAAAAKGVGYAPDYGYDDFDDEFDYHAAPAPSAFVGTGVSVDGTVVEQAPESSPDDNLNDGIEDLAEFPSLHRRRPAAATRKIDPDDELTAKVLPALVAILPSSTILVPTAFDHEPPRLIASMLMRSSILDKAAELLRNDSLEDATTRFGLYQRLLDLIRAFASGSRLTADILHSERIINKAGHDLLKVSYGLPTRMQSERSDTAASIMQSMTNLTSQSGMILRNAQANAEIFESEEGTQLIQLCTNIIDCNELLQTCTPRRSAKGKAKEDVCEDPDAWQKALAVLEVSDEDIFATHYSAKAAKDLQSPQTGRMRRVIKEITNLQTSLPPGIFVRHGESRLDVMKVLIVGPKGTPYENGLFEFDLWCPPCYPNEPPQMHIKTTGGGKHRFNPNLYADGKVCLSLLNTWQGARWTPGQSTILQVLVSIQAMIFCDEPHCNEPGFEHETGSDQSKEYNRNQYPAVIKYAMLEWLEGARTVTPSTGRGRYQQVMDEMDEDVSDEDKTQHPTWSLHGTSVPHATSKAHEAWAAKDKTQIKREAMEMHEAMKKQEAMLSMSVPHTAAPLPSGTSAPTNDFTKEVHKKLQAMSDKPVPDSIHVPPENLVPAKDFFFSGKFLPESFHKKHEAFKKSTAPVDKSEMWAPVVKKHFESKQDEILNTLCRWINDKSTLTPGRGKGRRLGTASEGSEAPAKFNKADDLKAKGKDFPKQLKAALGELSSGGKHGWGFFSHD